MEQQHPDLFENRKQFQLERMILFSDAVFAIAITLLVIEIKVPVLPHGDVHAFREAMVEKIPEFFGFFLSFCVIGQFWVSHHRLFGYITAYDNGLLWLNLHMLFWIALVPFSSGLNSHFGGMNAVWMWYSFNMFMIAMSLYFIWRYISNSRRNLSWIASDPRIKKMASVRSLTIALIFLAGLLLCLPGSSYLFWPSRLVYILMFPAMRLISRRYAPKK